MGGGVSPLVLWSKTGVAGLYAQGVQGVVGLGSSMASPRPSAPMADLSASRAMSMVDAYLRIRPDDEVVGEGEEEVDADLMERGDLGTHRNSACSSACKSATVTSGGRLNTGLEMRLYAGLPLFGVENSSTEGFCCLVLEALNMVCKLSRIFCVFDSVRCIVGGCMFARAARREEDGLSVSQALTACPTAMFCVVVLFISCTKYCNCVSSRSASRS